MSSNYEKKKAKSIARVWRWINVAVGYMADQGDDKACEGLENAFDALLRLDKPSQVETDFPGIILEPRKIFDKAKVGYTNSGWPVYDYYKLIPAVKKAHGIKSTDDAIDWISFNIYSFEGNGLLITSKSEPDEDPAS